jgi:glycosyltransferase involved in cell wall biosynthesis
MANQLLQLDLLLRSEGASVDVVPVNPPYRPRWVGGITGVRAAARLLPYAAALRRAARRVDLFHVFASSGWSWHLFAAPAVWIGHASGIPVVVNYRGGGAPDFLSHAARWVRPTLRRAGALVVPSEFLRVIFARFGFDARVVPNVIDADRFSPPPGGPGRTGRGPHVVIARNLEAVYDIETGLRAFALIRARLPAARLSIAGSGPERPRLEALALELGLGDGARFVGRIENEAMPALYHTADVVLNPSRADNMPISILEALASGVPVVTTDVGGIPYLVRHGETAQMVPPGNAEAMAESVVRVWSDPGLAQRQARAGLALAREYTWARVRDRLAAVYRDVLPAGREV